MATEVEALGEVDHAMLVVWILVTVSGNVTIAQKEDLPIPVAFSKCRPRQVLADGIASYF